MYVEIESSNMDKVLLEKAPRIAVYTPLTKQPWDDAVTLAMSYSEIPYTKIYDKEIVEGKLSQYDWLHLHHEDFTGQHSKFFSSFRTAPWYVNNVAASEKLSAELGFKNNVVLKKAVVLGIRDYVEKGGFLFAMCLACNTLDMSLASVKTDAVSEVFDGNPAQPQPGQGAGLQPVPGLHGIHHRHRIPCPRPMGASITTRSTPARSSASPPTISSSSTSPPNTTRCRPCCARTIPI